MLRLFIDFEKSFDSLEWSFIERTLQYFGFGPSLRKWIQLQLGKYGSSLVFTSNLNKPDILNTILVQDPFFTRNPRHLVRSQFR